MEPISDDQRIRRDIIRTLVGAISKLPQIENSRPVVFINIENLTIDQGVLKELQNGRNERE